MKSRPFIDTNIWVYAFSGEDARRGQAASLVAEGGIVSVQILNEFVDVARRKLRREWDAILQALTDIESLCGAPLPLTADTQQSAVRIASQHGLRIYDSLLIAVAEAAGCDVLYSEDMQHNRLIEGVRIINPFTPAA